jgi:hypothetical protein
VLIIFCVCRNGSRSSHLKQANLQLNQPLLGYLQNGRRDEGPWQIWHSLRHLSLPLPSGELNHQDQAIRTEVGANSAGASPRDHRVVHSRRR